MGVHDLILHERRRRSTEASVMAQEEEEEDLAPVLARRVGHLRQVIE